MTTLMRPLRFELSTVPSLPSAQYNISLAKSIHSPLGHTAVVGLGVGLRVGLGQGLGGVRAVDMG